jgi:hypothetical protein|tara:strand:+ start:228 stop:410 length:183 start_codon:yes stop_codon:yes gene_type:complete
MNQTRKRILEKLYPTKKVKVVLTDAHLDMIKKYVKPVDQLTNDGLVALFISKILKGIKND